MTIAMLRTASSFFTIRPNGVAHDRDMSDTPPVSTSMLGSNVDDQTYVLDTRA